jgi:glucose-1-phosphate thymidylyltransferase
MKGIVLAGGTGSRLWPITWGTSKQLLPVYDKPMIHYPIATLMLAGIREMLVITTKQDQESFQKLLGTGSELGVSFSYATQDNPDGIAQAFLIGESFIDNEPCALILGDNIFYGVGLGNQLQNIQVGNGAHIFAYEVTDPERYGVIEFDSTRKALSIEEKPLNPKSNFAIPGLYFYDKHVVEITKSIKPSGRGELEITSVNEAYLSGGKLNVTPLERGTVWLDAGTFDSLIDASIFIQVVEKRHRQKISCLEEIAWRNGWISDQELIARAHSYKSSPFAAYLNSLMKSQKVSHPSAR